MKTKALISCAGYHATTQLICTFVFAYAKSRFSHDATHLNGHASTTIFAGTSGQFCGIVLDGCVSSRCGSHGNCKNLFGNFSCTCEAGYTGKLLVIFINF